MKRLFALSNNRCAMFGCKSPLVVGDHVVSEICHIRARRKNGSRYDPSLTAAEKDDFKNLVLLCATHHTLIDKDAERYTPELLLTMKSDSERGAVGELTPESIRQALLILEHQKAVTKKTTNITKSVSAGGNASAKHGSAAVGIGGDSNAPINITIKHPPKAKAGGYPPNSIGADANLSGYIDYLFEKYADYMSSLEDRGTSWGKLGKHLKKEFRIGGARTRYHIPSEKFYRVVDYLVHKKLAITPIGRQHVRRGTRLCRSFEEWRSGKRD